MGLPEHIDPTEGISPNVVEWYGRYGRFEDYLRPGSLGGHMMAQRMLQRLDRLVRTEQRDLLKRLLEEKRAHPDARSISVKKIQDEIDALENGGRP